MADGTTAATPAIIAALLAQLAMMALLDTPALASTRNVIETCQRHV